MKKTLFLAALMAAAGWGTIQAQSVPDPICNITFKAQTGADPTYATRIQNTGTGGNEVSEYMPDANYNVTRTGTFQDLESKDYLGYTNINSDCYYWCKYDAEDALGKAFSNKCTWEILIRLDKNEGYSGASNSSTGTTKFFSSQQGGGWSLCHYPRPADGFKFDYVQEAGTTTVKSGVKLITGKFYHLLVTTNMESREVALYVNGEKVNTGTLKASSAFRFPNCGTTKRSKGMWFNIGGDPDGSDEPTNCENSTRATYVFARIYGTDLSEAQVKSLYTDKVKHYTEPQKPNKDDIILDAVFAKDGGFKDYSAYSKTTQRLARKGTLTTQYNSDQQRYEMEGPGDGTGTAASNGYLYRQFQWDPSVTSQLGDAFSIECYAKAKDWLSSFSQSAPLSFIQDGGGAGVNYYNYSESTKYLNFTCAAYGYDAGVNQCKGTQSSMNFSPDWDIKGYHHYVTVYDRVNKKSYIYVDGVLKKDNSDAAFPESTNEHSFAYARYQWFCVGGDAANVVNSRCDFPLYGYVSVARVWGKALTADDVAGLYASASNTSKDIEIGKTGYATVRLPMAFTVPTKMKAYVVTEQTGTTATLTELATEGEAVGYGTPVILAAPQGNYTLHAADLQSVTPKTAATNLLEGSYATKDVKANEVYVLADNGSGKAVLRKTDALTIPANKAWLPATAGGASAKTFVTGGGLDAISAVKAAGQDAKAYYNLQGQPVSQPQRGIYIQGGKKVFVK